MTGLKLTLLALALAPFPLAAQARAVGAPVVTASRTVPKRTYTGGRFIIEIDGAAQQAWYYDPAAGTLTPAPVDVSGSAGRGQGIAVGAIAGIAVGAVAARSNPIPSIGIVVKSNAGGAPSERGQLRHTLVPMDNSSSSRGSAGPRTQFFPLPTSLSAGDYDIVITIPREAIAAADPGNPRGETQLTFTVSKVPGGYDAIRPPLLR